MMFPDIMNKTNKKGKKLDNFTRDMICALAMKIKWKRIEILKKNLTFQFQLLMMW
jgi:hypothetical protein